MIPVVDAAAKAVADLTKPVRIISGAATLFEGHAISSNNCVEPDSMGYVDSNGNDVVFKIPVGMYANAAKAFQVNDINFIKALETVAKGII